MNNLKKMQAILQDGQVDALLLTSEVSRLYAAGYRVAEGVAVIGKTQCFYFTDSRYIEAAEINLRDFKVQEVSREHPYMNRINEALAALGAQKLGIEERYLTYAAYVRYKEKLQSELVPCQTAISSPRQVKDRWEIAEMEKAQKITDKTFAELCKIIHAGMTEKELTAELIYRLYKNGAEGLSFQPIVLSGSNTSMPHGVPGDRQLVYGDFITMDFGCTYHGYCSDMTRTVALGFVSEEMRHVYETVRRAQQAGMAATKAGVTGQTVDSAARRIITEAGYGKYFGHGYGHSVGLEIHEAPNCNLSNDTPLQVGVMCSAEPGIYLPGKFGVRIEDVVEVTADGCRSITGSPKNLVIL